MAGHTFVSDRVFGAVWRLTGVMAKPVGFLGAHADLSDLGGYPSSTTHRASRSRPLGGEQRISMDIEDLRGDQLLDKPALGTFGGEWGHGVVSAV